MEDKVPDPRVILDPRSQGIMALIHSVFRNAPNLMSAIAAWMSCESFTHIQAMHFFAIPAARSFVRAPRSLASPLPLTNPAKLRTLLLKSPHLTSGSRGPQGFSAGIVTPTHRRLAM